MARCTKLALRDQGQICVRIGDIIKWTEEDIVPSWWSQNSLAAYTWRVGVDSSTGGIQVDTTYFVAVIAMNSGRDLPSDNVHIRSQVPIDC